jgi:predicted transcriptional regulator
MAQKTRTREITIVDKSGTFETLFKKFSGEKKDYDFEGLTSLRRLLTNEKARLLHLVKSKKPNSIYKLAKILKRDFKSVSEDLKLLERFGFVELVSERNGNRESLRPLVVVDSINIQIRV